MIDVLDVYEILLSHGLERGVSTANLARALMMAFNEGDGVVHAKMERAYDEIGKVVSLSAHKAVKKAPSTQGEQTHPNSKRLSEAQRKAIKTAAKRGTPPADLAGKYGVSLSTIDRWSK